MASSYPTSQDSFARPTSGVDSQDNPNSATLANDHSGAIEALEAKVGTGSGTPTSGKVLKGGGTAGSSAWGDLAADNLSDVDTSTAAPAVGDALVWDGTNWVPDSGTYARDEGADVVANRPAASPDNAGGYFFSTDEGGGTLYRSNGSSWVQVAGPVEAEETAKWLPLSWFDITLGGATYSGEQYPSGPAAFTFIDAGTSDVQLSGWRPPESWSTLDIHVLLFNEDADSGTVARVQPLTGTIADGSSADAVPSSGGVAVDWTAGAARAVEDVTLASGIAVPASGFLHLGVRRAGSHANDNLANSTTNRALGLMGVYVVKAS